MNLKGITMSKLCNIHISDGASFWNEKTSVFHIGTPHALSQAAGYLKFINPDNGNVFFRGQNRCYDSMKPSLFREARSFHGMSKRIQMIRKYLSENKSYINGTPSYAEEAILQQYGFKTRWLDLVDNIWIALWFATHKASTTGKNNEYVNFEPSCDDYSYIFLMQFGNPELANDAGLSLTDQDYFVIDLRIAAPSIYLRPHSQHGLMARRRVYGEAKFMDYADNIVGILRVETQQALQWLGNGALSSTHFVFPPPTYDHGYHNLIIDTEPDPIIGCIQFIGP